MADNDEHFHIGPSALGVLIKCTYYHALRQLHPETSTSDASAEGSAAHWFSEQQLNGVAVAIGAIAPNGVEVDRDLAYSTFDYVNYCQQFISRGCRYAVEQRLEMPQFTAGMYGTADFIAVDFYTRTIHVVDAKFGRILVEAEGNYQLAAYALGVLNWLGLDGEGEQPWKFRLTIFQPRAHHNDGPVRHWDVTPGALRSYWNDIQTVVARIMRGDYIASTGLHCVHCPGRYGCETFRKTKDACVEISEQGSFHNPTIESLESEFLEIERALALLKARGVSVEEQLTARIKQGGYVTKVELQQNYGNRQWVGSDDEIIALENITKVKMYDRKLRTPASIEAEGVPREFLDEYTTRKPSSIKLKRKTGKSLAEKVFGNAN